MTQDHQALYQAWRGKAERYEQTIKMYKSLVSLQLALLVACLMTLVYISR